MTYRGAKRALCVPRFFVIPGLAAMIAIAGCSSSIDTAGLGVLTGEQTATPSFGFSEPLPTPTPRANAVAEATAASPDTAAAAPVMAMVETDPATTAVPIDVASATEFPVAPNAELAATNAAADTATNRIETANAAPVGTARQIVTADAEAAETLAATTAPQLALASATQPAPAPAPTIAQAAPVVAATAPAQRTGMFRALFNRERVSPPAAVPKPVQVAALAPETQAVPQRRVVATASARSSSAALPGVDRDRALGVNRAETRIEVASAAGLARLAPNGLKTQHSGVDIKCLKPALVRLLKQVESKYGKAPIVTSGYRSPERNRRARGAKNSLHIYCAAADIQVPGISKWDLASYLRSMPGRGGVGTYCHTKSVHIDIGPRRDWNARCRRR